LIIHLPHAEADSVSLAEHPEILDSFLRGPILSPDLTPQAFHWRHDLWVDIAPNSVLPLEGKRMLMLRSGELTDDDCEGLLEVKSKFIDQQTTVDIPKPQDRKGKGRMIPLSLPMLAKRKSPPDDNTPDAKRQHRLGLGDAIIEFPASNEASSMPPIPPPNPKPLPPRIPRSISGGAGKPSWILPASAREVVNGLVNMDAHLANGKLQPEAWSLAFGTRPWVRATWQRAHQEFASMDANWRQDWLAHHPERTWGELVAAWKKHLKETNEDVKDSTAEVKQEHSVITAPSSMAEPSNTTAVKVEEAEPSSSATRQLQPGPSTTKAVKVEEKSIKMDVDSPILQSPASYRAPPSSPPDSPPPLTLTAPITGTIATPVQSMSQTTTVAHSPTSSAMMRLRNAGRAEPSGRRMTVAAAGDLRSMPIIVLSDDSSDDNSTAHTRRQRQRPHEPHKWDPNAEIIELSD
jgi:hypothetical protein